MEKPASSRAARIENSPWLRAETRHRGNRRAYGHDYKAPGVYMITMTAERSRPAFSIISENADRSPLLSLTPLGELVTWELTRLPEFHPQFEVRASVVMPDHIHFILYVRERLTRELGQELAGFKGACSAHYHTLFPGAPGNPLFSENFNDRIVKDTPQYLACAAYIADNPRRLLVRRLHPDLFRRYNRLKIGQREYAAYGNIFLLRDFQRLAVMVHRADTAADKAMQRREWLECAANGGVLVSPFISKEEKAVRDAALSLGGSIITVRHNGFPDRFKPAAAEFALCEEDRLLIIAPLPESTGVRGGSREKDNGCEELTRAVSLRLNAIAAEIAALNPDDRVTLLGQ